MIPLHCLWAKSNNRTRSQSECDVTWFRICFDFVRSYARCSCFAIVCLSFQVVQIKQVDCKMSTKHKSNYKLKKKHFVIFLDNCTHKEYKTKKKQIARLLFETKGEFDIGRPRWKNFDCRWTRGWGFLKIGQFSWTSYVHHPLLISNEKKLETSSKN